MTSKYTRPALTVVGVLLTAVAVYWLLDRLRGHWGELWQGLTEANYVYVLPAVLLLAVAYALRVLRWRVFLNPIQRVPHRDITSATLIGFMSSCVLPLRPGEVIRPYVLHRKTGMSFGHAAGTAMGLERVFDLFGICFLLLLAWALILTGPGGRPGPPDPGSPAVAAQTPPAPAQQADGEAGALTGVMEQMRASSVWFLAFTAAAMACLLALAVRPALMLRIAGFFLGVLPASWRETLMGFLGSITHSMGFLKNPGQVATALLISFGQWFCFPVSTYCLARAFGLELSFAGALVVQIFLTAAVAAPQAPGFIGVFQWAAITGVRFCTTGPWDAEAQMATMTFAMMLWAVNVIPITVVGLAVLRHEGFRLRRLARMSQEAAKQAEPQGSEAVT